jgi:hypothetical protein
MLFFWKKMAVIANQDYLLYLQEKIDAKLTKGKKWGMIEILESG